MGASGGFDPFQPVTTPEEARAWLSRYARWGENGKEGPVLLVREVLLRGMTELVDVNDESKGWKPAEPDTWQEEFLRVYGSGQERRMTEKSGHGPGKSACLAWIIVHHLVTEFPQKTAVTAPTEKQLFNALYPEVVKWFQKLPQWLQGEFEIKADRLEQRRKPEESFVSFATARPEKPEALAGIHCEDGSVLLVADEASGVPEAVFESASGSMSGRNATIILAGNPVRTSGLFYDSHTKLARRGERTVGDWYAVTVNCETSRRVSRDFIEEKARRYGRDSNEYRIRVLGEFPTADADTIIPIEHILAAQSRDITTPPSDAVWGVDVARFGDDRSALVKRIGSVVEERPKVWQGKDTMQLAALIHEEWNATPPPKRPRSICVDVIGIGSGVVDRLRMLGLPVRGVNVAETSSFSDRYQNLKAELWMDKAKTWFAAKDCRIPPDDQAPGGIALGAELGLPRFRYLPSGKWQVESKQEIKRRGFPSPDVADAFILTLADTAATYHHGSLKVNDPLKRGLKFLQGI